jgi:hypothetical protein
MPRQRTKTKWNDTTQYVQVYCHPAIRSALKTMAAQAGTTIPEELEKLVTKHYTETPNAITAKYTWLELGTDSEGKPSFLPAQPKKNTPSPRPA